MSYYISKTSICLNDFNSNVSVFQDGMENINNDNKYKTGYHTVLHLSNVTEEDAGEYVCSVENTVGITFGDPVKIDVVCKNYFRNIKSHPFDINLLQKLSCLLTYFRPAVLCRRNN